MLNLSEYRTRPAGLSDLLPWGFLVAPGIILNKDGSFQRSAQFRGPDLESSTESELVAVTARINNVLRRFGSGWTLYFDAERVPARRYPRSAFPDRLSQLVDDERRRGFGAAGRHFESVFRLTLAYLPPPDSWSRAGDALIERPPAQSGETVAWRAHLEHFQARTDRAFALLADVMPSLAPLSDEATLTYLHDTVSAAGGRVRPPGIPAHLDAILADTPLAGGIEPMLGNLHLRTLTVLGFPNLTRPGLLDDLNDLPFAYRWMTRFLVLGKDEAERELGRCRRQWFAKRKSVLAMLKEVAFSQEAALTNSDADLKAADADQALQELGEDLVAFGYVTTSVTVRHESAAVAAEQMLELERVLHGRGFATIRERLNAVESWLGSLPGHAYANVRQPVIHTLNLAHMMPLSAVWAGPGRNAHLAGPPLLYARTRGTTPFRLSLHVGDVGHTLVVGPTGAGKSVLLAMLALQFRRYPGAQVYVFDKGASCRATVLGLGGTFLDLGGDSAGLAFQPLRRIDQETERSFAFEWTAALLQRAGIAIDPAIRRELWEALTNLAGAPPAERTLTGLGLLLARPELRDALQPWTLTGPHGRVLDADEDALALSEVQGFEMERLLETQGLAVPVLSYLFHRLRERFDGRPTMVVLDEAWVFLDDPLFAAQIREWLKTLRKRNVSVVFATQSPSDIVESSVAPAILESCPSRIFLPNERAQEPAAREVYTRLGLNDRQVELLARATPKRDYYYQSRRGARVFDLELGEIALTFAGASSKEDQARIDAALARGGQGRFLEAFLAEQSGHRGART
jgi:type IV secretion system protein VirB4